MKKAARYLTLLLLTAVTVLTSVVPAAANYTGDAREAVDTAAQCSLTLTYSVSGVALEGQQVSIYQAASIDADGVYALTGAFSGYPLRINAPRSQTEWRELTVTLCSYVAAGQISATATQTVGGSGTVKFTGLKPGLYLVSALRGQVNGVTYVFDSFVISVPGLDDNGYWFYDVAAVPKWERYDPSPSQLTYHVVKTWRDAADKSKRPDSVTVVLYKDGKQQEKRVLNAANNWMYTWTAANDGSVWTVSEPAVPEGYTVSQRKNGNTFIVINTRPSTPSTPSNPSEPGKPNTPGTTSPRTGDTTNLPLFGTLLAASGTLTAALMLLSRRKRHEA